MQKTLRMFKITIVAGLILLSVFACKRDAAPELTSDISDKTAPIIEEFGYILNDYFVIKDTIKTGETFGEILSRHKLSGVEIHNIAASAMDTFDIKKLIVGRPYTILAKNDTTQKAQVFIYQPNQIEYLIVDFKDTVQTTFGRKEVRIETKTASGMISSSLSEAMNEEGLNYILAHEMSEIYAWSIDFFHLQKGDNFKLIYDEKFIDDTVSVGVGNIKAAYFEHKGKPTYAFHFMTDSINNRSDYYDDNAKFLRRQFLKAPLEFSRISSRYNLTRRIKFYGYRIRPHLGTDFAAPVGTPIMSTANGTVIASEYNRGNGNYVKVKHNPTYTTQYLHMNKRKVRAGQSVRQGEVIGYVGMTGNTSGPHVCYRFWKNGKQIDPLKEKLPEAEPIRDDLKGSYFTFIQPLKTQLNKIPAKKITPAEEAL